MAKLISDYFIIFIFIFLFPSLFFFLSSFLAFTYSLFESIFERQLALWRCTLNILIRFVYLYTKRIVSQHHPFLFAFSNRLFCIPSLHIVHI